MAKRDSTFPPNRSPKRSPITCVSCAWSKSPTSCEARAKYIVSGDKDLLVLQEFRGVQIVRASDFLKVVDAAKR